MSESSDELDVVALILSFFIPGVGQIYQGRTKEGALFLVAAFIAGISGFFLIGLVLYPMVWVLNMYDVYAEWLDL